MGSLLVESWPGLTWESKTARIRHIELFLLEEVAWHLRENSNELFTRESDGLRQIVAELNLWQQVNT